MDREKFYNSLPLELRWKWCRSNIIDGEKVEAVRLKMEDEELVAKGISELKSRFSEGMPVVGLYFMEVHVHKYLLVLCVKHLCLFLEIVHSSKLSDMFSEQLNGFLLDESIFFSGFNVQSQIFTRKGCEIRQVAANVLNIEPLARCGGLAELASQIGYGKLRESDELKVVPSDCKAKLFSEKQMKKALHSAYHSYHIAVKLLGMM